MIHRAMVCGKPVTLVWGNPRKKLTEVEQRGYEKIYGLAITYDDGSGKIYLHPEIRKHGRQMIARVAAHEWLHQFVEIPRKTKKRGYGKPILTHAQIEKLALPFGDFLDSIASSGTRPPRRPAPRRRGSKRPQARRRGSS